MKLIIFLFLVLQSSFLLAQLDGEVVRVKPGTYKLIYEEQIMNIYFNTAPIGDFKDKVAGLVFTEQEELSLIDSLRAVIQELPARVRSRYLGVDIFMLTILKSGSLGYYYNNQIVLECDMQRLEKYGRANFKFTFGHELSHHITERSEGLPEMKALESYLINFRKLHSIYNTNAENTYQKNGFYGAYSYNRFGEGYKVREEMADLIALFLLKNPALTTVWQSNEYKLFANKLNYINDFLKGFEPEIASYDQPIIGTKNIGLATVQKDDHITGDLQANSMSVNKAEDKKSSTSRSFTIAPADQNSMAVNNTAKDEKYSSTETFSYQYGDGDLDLKDSQTSAKREKEHNHKKEKKKKRKRKNKHSKIGGAEILGILIAVTAGLWADGIIF
jgi:hypothetical protein